MAKTSRKRRGGRRKNKTGLMKPLLYFLLAVIMLGGIALMVSYYLAWRDGDNKPTVNELSVVKMDEKAGEDATVTVKNNRPTETGTKPPIASQLQGHTWVSTMNGAMLAIEGDRYTIDFPSVDERKPMTGNITFTQSGFILINPDSDDHCENKAGSYTFRFDGDDLIIKNISDACRKRSSNLETIWFKL